IAANAWLRIGTDDSITFLCDRSEMGQGVYTALPTLLAEELGVDPRRIAIEFAPAGAAYVNALLGGQVTGGSTSVRDAWTKLRTAGAQAREMLKSAAAREWDTSAGACRVEDGTIISPFGKRLSYGAVAEAAAKLPVPKDVVLKAAKDFVWIGKPLTRFDTPAKVDGSATFGIDVKLPGMLYAALAQPPMLGGKVKTVDGTAAQAMPGVRQVVTTNSGVAVVADSWWQARKARDALRIEWDGSATAGLNDGAILRGLKQASGQAGLVARQEGDAEAALKSAARVVRAEYQLPLLAHATLEPQVCTADVRAGACDLYLPTQTQAAAQAAAAAAAGLAPAQVNVHTTFLGGGFGRRLEVDVIAAAVQASQAVGKPVKLLWTREDDTTHDAYRPPAYDTVAAAFDRDGKLVAWKLHLTGPSITARVFPGAVPAGSVDPFCVEAAANYPYDVPNVLVDWVPHEVGLNVGYWRSVSHALNCFVAESFMDELAVAAGEDPAAFRRALLAKQPRYLEVLDVALRRSGYGTPATDRFRGVAVMEGYDTYMAQVAEISIVDGKVRVHRIVCAVDCGQVVNPGIVTAQVESAIVFGLSAALWGEINVQGGRVQQSNFHDYRVVRHSEMPAIETWQVASDNPPGGIGEPATALVAPALCNAIHAATKRRLRSLPITRHNLA
ncbi:MAG: xanthine dehydrogenase family protein molybdopterin-binding subunit, partial [Steroidobacteraceae bacterium]|nr:xanthine dehydrogenase family protein molybdopterin-binding subunit [Steroidobacteraceae bacterium]